MVLLGKTKVIDDHYFNQEIKIGASKLKTCMTDDFVEKYKLFHTFAMKIFLSKTWTSKAERKKYWHTCLCVGVQIVENRIKKLKGYWPTVLKTLASKEKTNVSFHIWKINIINEKMNINLIEN